MLKDENDAALFSTEELEIFIERGLSERQIELIVEITDRDKQQQLAALVASGLRFKAAWMCIFGTTSP
jgi:hypothetical protein